MQPPHINLPGEDSYSEPPRRYEPLPTDMSLVEIANTTDPKLYVRAISASALVMDEIYRTLTRRDLSGLECPNQITYRVGRLYTGLGEACVLRGLYGGNQGDVANSLTYFLQADNKLTMLEAVDESFEPPQGELTIGQALNLNSERAAEALQLLGDSIMLWLADPPELIDVSSIVFTWRQAIGSALLFCNTPTNNSQDRMRKCA